MFWTAYLEVWREVLVGLVLVGLVEFVLGQREDQEVLVVGVSRVLVGSVRHLRVGRRAAVLQLVEGLLWARDEEGVDPEVEHLFLKGQRKTLVRLLSSGSVYSVRTGTTRTTSSPREPPVDLLELISDHSFRFLFKLKLPLIFKPKKIFR